MVKIAGLNNSSICWAAYVTHVSYDETFLRTPQTKEWTETCCGQWQLPKRSRNHKKTLPRLLRRIFSFPENLCVLRSGVRKMNARVHAFQISHKTGRRLGHILLGAACICIHEPSKTPGCLGRGHRARYIEAGQCWTWCSPKEEILRTCSSKERSEKVTWSVIRAPICLSNLFIILSVFSVLRVRYVQSRERGTEAQTFYPDQLTY